jgi:putative lipoic acid-binding regulatory protein
MTDQDLEKFRNTLLSSITFPSVYMFKFIIESDLRNIALVENLFVAEADIHTKESGNGKYTSVTAKLVVMNVDEILEVYKNALKIKGIIFL